MRIHTYVEGRLLRWSAWVNMTKALGPRRVVSWWGPMVMNPNVEQIPVGRQVTVDAEEAEETELAVRALPRELRDAVTESWTRAGTMEQHALALHCSRVTLYARLERANVQLLGFMNDLAAGVPLPVPEPTKNILTDLYKKSTFPAIVA